MKSTLLLEIIDEIEKILNKNYNNFDPFIIRISKHKISLFVINEITLNNDDYKFSCRVIIENKITKGFFAGLAQFLKDISKKFGHEKEIKNIIRKLNENVEMTDVLESI